MMVVDGLWCLMLVVDVLMMVVACCCCLMMVDWWLCLMMNDDGCWWFLTLNDGYSDGLWLVDFPGCSSRMGADNPQFSQTAGDEWSLNCKSRCRSKCQKDAASESNPGHPAPVKTLPSPMPAMDFYNKESGRVWPTKNHHLWSFTILRSHSQP